MEIIRNLKITIIKTGYRRKAIPIFSWKTFCPLGLILSILCSSENSGTEEPMNSLLLALLTLYKIFTKQKLHDLKNYELSFQCSNCLSVLCFSISKNEDWYKIKFKKPSVLKVINCENMEKFHGVEVATCCHLSSSDHGFCHFYL